MALIWSLAPLGAQETFPVNDVQDRRADAYAFVNAVVWVDYQTKLDNAVLLIRDGKVERVGQNLTPPEGYVTVDVSGKWIYPGLIDLYTSYGLPEIKRERGRGFFGPEQIEPETKGPYNANDAIKAHYNAVDELTVDAKEAKGLRGLGFGATLTHRRDGIARGSSALATLAEDSANNVALMGKAAAHLSLNRGTSQQNFPRSTMGAMALLRQTYLDGQWYAGLKTRKFTDRSLDAWLQLQELPQIFEANDWKTILRGDKVGDEFGKQYIFKSGGDEYQRIEAMKATGGAVIAPVNFPDAYDVADPFDAEQVSLSDMKHWELAPTNPAALEKAGIPFALTTFGLGPKNMKKFWSNVRKAIAHGLSEEAALRALTYTPAALIGAESQLGSLQTGRVANFLIVSGNLFDEKAKIYENWIQGHRYVLSEMDEKDYRGKYALTVGDDLSFELEISGEPGKHKASIKTPGGDEAEASDAPEEDEGDEAEAAEEGEQPKKPGRPGKPSGPKVDASFDGNLATIRFSPEKDGGAIRLSGWRDGQDLVGRGNLPDGASVAWRAEYQGALDEKDKKDGKPKKDKDPLADIGSVTYPFTAYGWETAPQPETILIRNATVWTNEADGVLQGTDVLVRDGKIAKVGKGLKAPRGAREIDGTGKHLTPGIIDEHSHIALDGTNDVATNSGMVRMADVVDSEDVNLYRQLAGGVTAAQLLHGSANPIGGQSALVKFRWGATPQDLLIENADGFIKFALGENVKRSRSSQSVRYPQTRMGVEQVYMDAFTAASDYARKRREFDALSDADKAKTTAPRRDLALDAMAEIIAGERFITCHSYVQSEINMLMKVAEKFDFRVNTFTHILEGYKVADKMAAHGAGGSTFSDWWAYKWEVRYAIPYNPALMTLAGVTVAVNSDDAEMARRLNQEAAKGVKYGGMSEEDALKMVTLNPAKLLHLDDRMGSVKAGKDADLVLWTDHPLSIYAKAETTMVDGIVYYDMARDRELRDGIRAERSRLIQKMLDHKKSGGPTSRRMSPRKVQWTCETIVMDGELVGGHGH